jgi:V-type H+-transporting ATPase subunit H
MPLVPKVGRYPQAQTRPSDELPGRFLLVAALLRAGCSRTHRQVRSLSIQTYYRWADHTFVRRYDLILLLVDVAQAAVKEKVIRVIVATFRVCTVPPFRARAFPKPHHWSQQNLVTKAPAANLPSMLVAELLPFVKNLCGRKWSDEDVVEDVQFLREELTANFESLTCVTARFRGLLQALIFLPLLC